MIKHRSISIVVTAFATIFLTFLGMRISLLDPHTKPKPRPRAVLKLSSKAPTTGLEIKKELQPVATIITVYTVTPSIVAGRILPASPQMLPPLTVLCAPTGRSPPCC